MDAPIYPPAAMFQPPVAAPWQLSVNTVSIGELESAPATWAIVLKHAPAMKFVVATPQAKANVWNFTFDLFVTLGVVDRAAVTAIDAELRSLPRSQWPVQ